MENTLHHELFLRIRNNENYIWSTVIFLRVEDQKKSALSGYIDFEQRLRNGDLDLFFQGKTKLRPRESDLSFYNWGTGKARINDSSNYNVYVDENKGLLFRNVHDGKVVTVNPWSVDGAEERGMRIHSDDYADLVLYDYVLRGKTKIQ